MAPMHFDKKPRLTPGQDTGGLTNVGWLLLMLGLLEIPLGRAGAGHPGATLAALVTRIVLAVQIKRLPGRRRPVVRVSRQQRPRAGSRGRGSRRGHDMRSST